MKQKIDAIITAFAPEMERITDLNESKDRKVEIARDWLRGQLEQFAAELLANCRKEMDG
jgi:hypothetical protein